MILIVSITKLLIELSIIVQILQLNNLVFQIRCKINTTKGHYKSEDAKMFQKKCIFIQNRRFGRFLRPFLFQFRNTHLSEPTKTLFAWYSVQDVKIVKHIRHVGGSLLIKRILSTLHL